MGLFTSAHAVAESRRAVFHGDRIVRDDLGMALEQAADEGDRGGFADVVGARLERHTPHRESLTVEMTFVMGFDFSEETVRCRRFVSCTA